MTGEVVQTNSGAVIEMPGRHPPLSGEVALVTGSAKG